MEVIYHLAWLLSATAACGFRAGSKVSPGVLGHQGSGVRDAFKKTPTAL